MSAAAPITSTKIARVERVSAARLVRIEIDGEEKYLALATARELVRDLNQQIAELALDDTLPNRVIKAVMLAFDVSYEELLGPHRTARICDARFAAFYILHKVCGLTTMETGRAMLKDHSTVVFGAQRCDELMASDATYRAKLEPLRAAFQKVETHSRKRSAQ